MDMNPPLILFLPSSCKLRSIPLRTLIASCSSIQSPRVALNTRTQGYAFRTRSSSYSSCDNGDNLAVISKDAGAATAAAAAGAAAGASTSFTFFESVDHIHACMMPQSTIRTINTIVMLISDTSQD